MEKIYQVARQFTDVNNKIRFVDDVVVYPNYYGIKLVQSGYLIKISPEALSVDQKVVLLEKLIPILDPKVKLTPDGGVAVKMTNKTGESSIEGTVVGVSHSGIDNAVQKIIVDIPDPIGVIAENGVSDGAEVWVVISGIAKVLFIGNTTRGHLARGFLSSDSGYISGYGLSEAVPTSPFANDKHFYEFGHVLESRVGAGLSKCVLHFN